MAEVCEATGARRARAGRGARPTTPASAAGSSSRDSASAVAACPRTSGRSRTGPRSWASAQAVAFLREVDVINQRAPGPHRRPGPRTGRRRPGRHAGRRARRRLQAQLRRHPRRAGAGRGAARCTGRGDVRGLRPGGAWTTPAARYPELRRTATNALDAARDADVVVLLDRVGGVPRDRPAARWARGRAPADRGRPARPRPGAVAGCRLGVPGARPPVMLGRL